MSSARDSESPLSTPERRTITWDEKTIKEQDRERGTRTKIAEVSTPFCYASDVDSQDESSSYYGQLDNSDLTQEVINRLCAIKETYEKKRVFSEHRKEHYNNEFNRQNFHLRNDDDINEGGDLADIMKESACNSASMAAP
ncbi:phosphatase inhibitor 2 domain-containing protein [Babesia divergens]|uniref:Phosphatase inhibitor 2 domain-containing protein n=1 Tax=Babesia divergens TaxID=32595 RepID=A0AAD9GHP6_BABDI|nr:phosphatase inhibitor 2 domain-containing protein [Babesia divergens]